MIDNDLKIAHMNGSLQGIDRERFFKGLTFDEAHNYGDMLFRCTAEKSYSSISMAHRSRDNFIMEWRKYNQREV